MPRPSALAALAMSALALLLLASSASAQDPASQAYPVPWSVFVDDDGFVGDVDWNFTQGDWVRLEVTNIGDAAQTVSVDGYGITLQVAAYGEALQVFQANQAGTFAVGALPSGDEATVLIVDADVVDYESGAVDSSGNPGQSNSSTRAGALDLVIVVGLLAGMVLLIRKA